MGEIGVSKGVGRGRWGDGTSKLIGATIERGTGEDGEGRGTGWSKLGPFRRGYQGAGSTAPL